MLSKIFIHSYSFLLSPGESKSSEDLMEMKDIVHDTFNAVNELKDLQRSFKRSHSERNPPSIIISNPDSHKCKPDSQKSNPDSLKRFPDSSDSFVTISESQAADRLPPEPIARDSDTDVQTNREDKQVLKESFSLEYDFNKIQVKHDESDGPTEIRFTPLETSDSKGGNAKQVETQEHLFDFKLSPLKLSTDKQTDINQHKPTITLLDNYQTYTDIALQPKQQAQKQQRQELQQPQPQSRQQPQLQQERDVELVHLMPTTTSSSKSRTFMSGLRKVASHLKPSFRSGERTTGAGLSKDASSEFSYAKRRNDEETMQQLETIASKFREEITQIQNMTLNNLTQETVDGGVTVAAHGAITTNNDKDSAIVTAITRRATETTAASETSAVPSRKSSSEDGEVILEKLSVKQNTSGSFMGKMFGKRRSYDAVAVNERQEKEKNRTSFCDNVFITPCSGSVRSPVSESYRPVGGRREMRMREDGGAQVHDCSFSSASSLSFDVGDETGGYSAERQPSPQQQQQHQHQHPQPYPHSQQQKSNVSLESSDITLPDDFTNSSTSYHALRAPLPPGPSPHLPPPCGYSPLPHGQCTNGSNSDLPHAKCACAQCAYNDYLNYVQFLHLRETGGYMWPRHAPYGGNYGGDNMPYASTYYGDNVPQYNANYYGHNYQQCSESWSGPVEECSRDNLDADQMFEAISEESSVKNDSCYDEGEEIVDSEYGTYV